MKKVLLLICPLCLLMITSSCATIFGGMKSKVTVSSSNYSGKADIIADNKLYNDIYLPYEVKVKKGYKPSNITVKANGYKEANITVEKKFNKLSLLNIFTPVIGFIVDAATGCIKKAENESYTVHLSPIQGYKEEKHIIEQYQQPIQKITNNNNSQSKNEPVSRENPGSTDLEKTIVRWYFESEPQGARIFWRVVSSCPDQVKNTNEFWLGNTPYEETRSFNIQGLTYENANNVQIEIKVKSTGYLDQTKRFNVRQAIDQQEISSFFDLIKKVE